ncbi:hypothetical protein H7E67_08820 [Clostridium gasigenes]|uniref:Uncharacterized protein n=1 Tax=Clostridium gasigenes TaxID=94869 RepID=A0A7X0VS72_9CLOT|nr:hypothetical protein [Clostridium gasigenes]MBB6623530.1 hypothetical protein [Clostridium gasigenes]MBB6715410.1 hypothetical protein [Clostridium gasigenes]
MQDKLKAIIKENQKFILAIITTIMFSLIIVFLISSNTGANKEMKQLKSIGTKISKINHSLSKGIKDLSIDRNKSIEVLSIGATDLKDIPIELSSIKTNYESTSNIKEELASALSTTITLYDYSIYLINDPEKVVIDENIFELTSYKDDCLNTYKLLTNQGIDISFSDDTITFFDNIKNYLNALIKVNKAQNIINSQKQDFIISLKSLIPYLNTLTEDLEPALNKIKEDKRDLQVLIDDIEAKEEIYKDVQIKLLSSSIPDGYGDYYTTLDEFSKLYTPYIESFKTALIFDNSCVDPIKNKKEINNNYKNIFSKYQDVLASYSKFKELLNNL